MNAVKNLGLVAVAGTLIGCEPSEESKALTTRTRDRLNDMVALATTTGQALPRTFRFYGQMKGEIYTVQVDVGADGKIKNFGVISQGGMSILDSTPDTPDLVKGKRGTDNTTIEKMIENTGNTAGNFESSASDPIAERQLVWAFVSNIPLDPTQWTREVAEKELKNQLESGKSGNNEDVPAEKQ